MGHGGDDAGAADGGPADARLPAAARASARRQCCAPSRTAMADRSYLLLHLGFFHLRLSYCLFGHHLPGEVNLYDRRRWPAGR